MQRETLSWFVAENCDIDRALLWGIYQDVEKCHTVTATQRKGQLRIFIFAERLLDYIDRQCRKVVDGASGVFGFLRLGFHISFSASPSSKLLLGLLHLERCNLY